MTEHELDEMRATLARIEAKQMDLESWIRTLLAMVQAMDARANPPYGGVPLPYPPAPGCVDQWRPPFNGNRRS